MSEFGSAGRAIVGSNASRNYGTVNGFISNQNGANLNQGVWCGDFTAAVMRSEGFNVPSGYANSQSWLNYGQPVTSGGFKVGDVAVWTPGNTGMRHVGVVTGIDDNGRPIVLQGNSGNSVRENAENPDKLVFRRPTDDDGKTPAEGGGKGSAKGDEREGSGKGNTDKKEENDQKANSKGPLGKNQHDDVKGEAGNYSKSSTSSTVSRMPTHEPWSGHPKSKKGDRQGLDSGGDSDGSTPGGQNGGNSPGGRSGGGTGSGGGGSSSGSDYGDGTSANRYSGTGKFEDKAAHYGERYRTAYEAKTGVRLSDNAVAAAFGNLGHESSGLVPGIQEGRPTVAGSRGGLGWAQWTGPRRVAFERYAANNGLDVKSDEANYRFFEHETLSNSTYRKSLSDTNNMSLPDATRHFEKVYEGAGIKHYASRDVYAQRALAALKKKKAAAAEETGDPGPNKKVKGAEDDKKEESKSEGESKSDSNTTSSGGGGGTSTAPASTASSGPSGFAGPAARA